MPPHQQTMRAMLDWSFDLLSPELQKLFCQLSVFPGSFTIPEAEAVCAIRKYTGRIDSPWWTSPCLNNIPVQTANPNFRMLRQSYVNMPWSAEVELAN